MIEVCRQPTYSRMAIVTIAAACYMGRMFAGCCIAIVAGSAGAEYLRVVHRCRWLKRNRAVAVFANIAG